MPPRRSSAELPQLCKLITAALIDMQTLQGTLHPAKGLYSHLCSCT